MKAYITHRNIIQEIFNINDPHGYAIVSFNPLVRQVSYEIIEPTLREQEKESLDRIKEHLVATITTTVEDTFNIVDAAHPQKGRVGVPELPEAPP